MFFVPYYTIKLIQKFIIWNKIENIITSNILYMSIKGILTELKFWYNLFVNLVIINIAI
jgi:hypothetical protein